MQKPRRNFLTASFLSTLVIVSGPNKLLASTTPLQTLAIVQEDLFPQKMITNANAFAYVSIVFKHSRISPENKQFLRNGIKWLNEEALQKHSKTYTKLNPKQRQNILQTISKESWGRSWIKTILNYIMEAALGDPIYGINKNESGWKWLEHHSGLPRPKKALL